jgi:hypothetical protein
MNGRSGQSREQQQGQSQPLNSQVGFYLLPPDQPVGGGGGRANSRSSRDTSKKTNNPRGRGRRAASQNHLDAIAEASDESRPPSPSQHHHHHQKRGGGGPAWNSSPARLIRDNTAPNRGLVGGQVGPGMDLQGSQRLQMNCRHPQGRLCENLKYSLHQLKLRGQRETYKVILYEIIMTVL